jgi:hypothetical protein
MNFSIKTRLLPKELAASEVARAKPSVTSLEEYCDAHTLTAASGGLNHDRIADLVGDGHSLLGAFDDAKVARHGRRLGSSILGLDLVAYGSDGTQIEADKDDADLLS